MGFFSMEGGTKRTNTTTNVYNQQQAIQGSGNFAVSGELDNRNGTINIQSLDPLAVDALENTALAAVMASQKYVEFSSEAVARGLEANASVAQMAIGTGMTPEQITASRGATINAAPKGIDPDKMLLLGVAVVGALVLFVKLKT
jgi:hypothetical protein